MWIKYISIFLVITAIGALYEKYKIKQEMLKDVKDYDLVQKFLLGNENVIGGKPFLWIHNTYNVNARNWSSFVSRNNSQLNQPYLHLCVSSIVKKCGNDFNVCFINDDSFDKLLPNWSIQMNKLPDPVKCHVRRLALCNVLYKYGGLLLPNSTLVLENLYNLHSNSLKGKDLYTFETVDRNSTSTYVEYFPDVRFLGCKQGSKSMKELIQNLELLNSTDYTSEMDFLGQANRHLYRLVHEGKATCLDGKNIGIKTETNRPVLIENLLGKSYINYDEKKLHAIYLPHDELLKRTKYEWFSRSSVKQILESNMIISKYFSLQ